MLKEQLDITVNVDNDKALKKLIDNMSEGMEPAKYLNSEILDDQTKQVNQLKKMAKLTNAIFEASGDERRVELGLVNETLEDGTESQKLGLRLQDKKINNDKKEVRGMEHLLRRYRWAQSLFLVTQNFVMRMGESVKVFGSGLNLILAPLVLFLNVILLPALPLLAAFSYWLSQIVIGFSDWYLENDKLSGAIGGLLFGALLAVIMLPIAGLIVGILESILGVLSLATALSGTGTALAIFEGGLLSMESIAIAVTFAIGMIVYALATLTGAIIGSLVVWAMYETGVMDAIATSGKIYARYSTNTMALFGNMYDYIVNYGKYALKKGAIIIGDFFMGVMKWIHDMPIIGEAYLPEFDEWQADWDAEKKQTEDDWKNFLDTEWKGLSAGFRIDPIEYQTAKTPNDFVNWWMDQYPDSEMEKKSETPTYVGYDDFWSDYNANYDQFLDDYSANQQQFMDDYEKQQQEFLDNYYTNASEYQPSYDTTNIVNTSSDNYEIVVNTTNVDGAKIAEDVIRELSRDGDSRGAI